MKKTDFNSFPDDNLIQPNISKVFVLFKFNNCITSKCHPLGFNYHRHSDQSSLCIDNI